MLVERRRNIVALIPARAGSKGIPGKNIKEICGKPLIQYSIEVAISSSCFNEIFVSTDSKKIAEIAINLGASVPSLRPQHLSEDGSSMFEVLSDFSKQALGDYDSNTVIVLLQPTSPLRSVEDIVKSLELFTKTSMATSLVSYVNVPHSFEPGSLMKFDQEYLVPLNDKSLQHLNSVSRQEKASYQGRNGPAILITTLETIGAGSLYGERTLGYLMPKHRSVDIDDMDDFRIAEALIHFGSVSL